MSQDREPHLNLNDHSHHPLAATHPAHHLWEPAAADNREEPLYRLRVSVLKDKEAQGDCPSRVFTFKTLTHVIHASDQITETFGKSFSGYTVKNLGMDIPEAGEQNVEDGRTQALTIEFDSVGANETWKEFLARLVAAERRWMKDFECLESGN